MSLAPFLSLLVFWCAIFSTKQPYVITLLIVLMTIETNFFNTQISLFVWFLYRKKCH